MEKSFLALLILFLACTAACGAEMTYAQARQNIRARQLPEFWIGNTDTLAARCEKLARGRAETIAKSPGGRPLYLVTFGRHEPVRHQANFNSAVGGQDPSAYMDKAARRKPVVYFLGPVHGHEVEGLTGLVNLIQIMETGRDLRGRDQAALRALGEQCRLLIIPTGNPDGVARFEPRCLQGMSPDELNFWGQGTSRDNTIVPWPISKRRHPFIGPEVGFMGCYFNDAGVNPMHDEFFAPMSGESPAILKVARDEGPDLAVSLHSHGSQPAVLLPDYVPPGIVEQVRSAAEAVYALLDRRGLPHARLPEIKPDSGRKPAAFNLTSAVYHTSGATAFTFECPHGLAGDKSCQVSLEQILDIQLALYEGMFRHAIDMKAKEPPRQEPETK